MRLGKTKNKPDEHYYEILEIMHEQGTKMTPKELRSLHKEMVKYGRFMGVPFMNRYPEFPLYVQTVTLLLLIIPLILASYPCIGDMDMSTALGAEVLRPSHNPQK